MFFLKLLRELITVITFLFLLKKQLQQFRYF